MKRMLFLLAIWIVAGGCFGTMAKKRSKEKGKNETTRIIINGREYEMSGNSEIHITTEGDNVSISTGDGSVIITNEVNEHTQVVPRSRKEREKADDERKKALKAAKEAREAAERARSEAELARQKAELARQNAERARKDAEKARQKVERTRQNASQRQDNSYGAYDRREAVSPQINRLVSNMSVDIEYVSSGKPEVCIRGSLEAVGLVRLTQENNSLEIGFKKSYGNVSGSELGKLKIVVSGLRLTNIETRSSGNIIAHDISEPSVAIKSSGSGDIRIERIDASAVSMLTGGSGDISVGKINAPSTRMNVMGSGDILVGFVDGATFRAHIQGSGDVSVNRLEAVNIELYDDGSGDMTIKGINANSLKAFCNGAGDISLAGEVVSGALYTAGTGDINARNLRSSRISKSSIGTGSIY